MTFRHLGISILTAAALLPLLGSCAKIETGTRSGDREITYTLPPIKTSTKAGSEASAGTPVTKAAATTPFDKAQTFGSRAYKLDAGKNWLQNYSDGEIFIPDNEISYQSDGNWRASSGQRYYWKRDGSSLTFLSWAPYNFGGTGSLVSSDNLTIDDTSREFTYTGWAMSATAGYGYTKDSDGNYIRNTADGSVDLLLAKSADRTVDNSSAGVLTEFVHQLCNVRVLATIMDEPTAGEEWHVTKVELSDIYTKANLLRGATTDIKTGIWGGWSDTATYTYDTSSSPIELTYTDPNTEVEIFPRTLMLPQSVLTVNSTSSTRSPKIKIYYNDENGDAKTLEGVLASNTVIDLTTWLAAKSITYHIYISTVDYWIDFDASATNWEDGTKQEIIIGSN